MNHRAKRSKHELENTSTSEGIHLNKYKPPASPNLFLYALIQFLEAFRLLND